MLLMTIKFISAEQGWARDVKA